MPRTAVRGAQSSFARAIARAPASNRKSRSLNEVVGDSNLSLARDVRIAAKSQAVPHSLCSSNDSGVGGPSSGAVCLEISGLRLEAVAAARYAPWSMERPALWGQVAD